MAPVLENGKWGFINQRGEMVIQPQFEIVDVFYNGSCIAKKDGKWGLIDKDGEIRAAMFDTLIRISPNRLLAKQNGLYGVIDDQGNFTIEPAFLQVAPLYFSDSLYLGMLANNMYNVISPRGSLAVSEALTNCSPFEMGAAVIGTASQLDDSTAKMLAAVGMDGSKYGMINRKGKITVPAGTYDDIRFNEANACYTSFKTTHFEAGVPYGKFGLIDTTGNIICQPTYDEVPIYGDGLFAVQLNGKSGYIDRSGKMVIPCQYEFAHPFGDGIAAVGLNGVPTFIDKKGKVVFTAPFMAGAFPFSNGRAAFKDKRNQLAGYIDRAGNIAVAAQYDGGEDFVDGRAVVGKDSLFGMIDTSGKLILPVSYIHIERLKKNIYQVVTPDFRYGISDANGHFIIAPLHDDVSAFDDATISVVDHGRYGCYTLDGKEIFPVKSKRDINFLNRNYAIADENGKAGLIDRNGKNLAPFVYDSVYVFISGYSSVVQGNKWGLIDSTGKQVVAPSYDELLITPSGYSRIKRNGKYGFIDKTGAVICEPRFDDAGPFTDPDQKSSPR